jgi:CRP/FNR family cyclic AMP-dependent transcriptional regulator
MPTSKNPLTRLPLFAAFAPADLASLMGRAVERRMVAGETLCHQGDAGTTMMAVLEGLVRVELPGAPGTTQVVRVLKAGEVFGELALFDGMPRSADVVAATNGRLLVIERASVRALMQSDVAFAERVIAVLCERVRATTAQVNSLRFQDSGQRLCAYLLQRLGEAGLRHIDITQARLAEIIGATRETVNRRLSELEAQAAIARTPGRITVLDPAKLHAHIAADT